MEWMEDLVRNAATPVSNGVADMAEARPGCRHADPLNTSNGLH